MIFSIEYKSGKENVAADALSRSLFLAWSELKFQIVQALKEAIQQDSQLHHIMELYV